MGKYEYLWGTWGNHWSSSENEETVSPTNEETASSTNKETVTRIVRLAAVYAVKLGLARSSFVGLCNEEFTKATPPPPPKPSETKYFSEADIFAALEDLNPDATKAIVDRLKKAGAKRPTK
jgi:hypothetical protein